MSETMGFIGLGTMGRPMAGRLLGARFPLIVWNLTSPEMADLAQKGAQVGGSPKEVAAQSDIVISMVTNGAALEAITFRRIGSCAGGALRGRHSHAALRFLSD